MKLITLIAREIRTRFQPDNYTPSEANLEGHLEGVDSAIGNKMDKDTNGTLSNLMVLDATGNAVDAGFAANVNTDPGSVVRRGSDGQIQVLAQDSTTIVSESIFGNGVYGWSQYNNGMQSETGEGNYHHLFGNVSAIDRETGALVFLGGNAVANRAAMRTGIGAAEIGSVVGMFDGNMTEIYMGNTPEGPLTIDLSTFGINIKSACLVVVAKQVIQDVQVEFVLGDINYVMSFNGEGTQQFIVPVSSNVFQFSTSGGADFRITFYLQAFWQ
jgi:hypothetical protein